MLISHLPQDQCTRDSCKYLHPPKLVKEELQASSRAFSQTQTALQQLCNPLMLQQQAAMCATQVTSRVCLLKLFYPVGLCYLYCVTVNNHIQSKSLMEIFGRFRLNLRMFIGYLHSFFEDEHSRLSSRNACGVR